MPSICEPYAWRLAAEPLVHERQAERTVRFTALLDRRAAAAHIYCTNFKL